MEGNPELSVLASRRAHEAGISVEGGWSCRNGSDVPDWDVVVTAVRKREGAD